jgi:hypothetical protein
MAQLHSPKMFIADRDNASEILLHAQYERGERQVRDALENRCGMCSYFIVYRVRLLHPVCPSNRG